MKATITPHEIPGAVGDEYTPTAINLQPFCSEPDDFRESLHHPWHEQGTTYASNGAAICAIPGVHTDIGLCKNAANLIAAPISLTWHPIEELAIDWTTIPAHTRCIACDACQGTGKAAYTPCDNCTCDFPDECDASEFAPHNTAACPHCWGHGRIYPQYSTYITDPLFKGLVFQSHLLRPFLDQFTNIEFAIDTSMTTQARPTQEQPCLRLRFNEGRGAIMPISPGDTPVVGASHAM